MLELLLFGLTFLSPPFLKLLLLRWFRRARIERGARIGWFSTVAGARITLGAHSQVAPCSIIRVGGDLLLGAYSQISSFTVVYGASDLELGEHAYLGPKCWVNADAPVVFGRESALGPGGMVFTHASFLPYTEGYWAVRAGVTLGERAWCAARVFLQPGTEIGAGAFVNAGSVVRGTIPPGAVVEGNPGLVVGEVERLRRRMTPARTDQALRALVDDYARWGLPVDLQAKDCEVHAHGLRFRWHGQRWEVYLVTADGCPPEADRAVRRIYISNRLGWQAPEGEPVLDIAQGVAPYGAGTVSESLRHFMRRYYGLKLAEARPLRRRPARAAERHSSPHREEVRRT